ncbi:MAG: dUTP pyrophosphatase [Deltaproteobacteria bacterium]|jgi:dUTP pyrophosphatase|nr:dUTP pyrophosphatase [Deltaproteobacteria bacterium]
MPIPKKAHLDDSGLDLSLIKVIQKRDNIFFFDTGISVEPPTGYYTELVPRSSIYKQDFIMANSVGIIDQGYRGLIMMPMRYVGKGNGLSEAENLIGERVGQLILKQLVPFQIEICDDLSKTQRGEGGFGSSGT